MHVYLPAVLGLSVVSWLYIFYGLYNVYNTYCIQYNMYCTILYTIQYSIQTMYTIVLAQMELSLTKLTWVIIL